MRREPGEEERLPKRTRAFVQPDEKADPGAVDEFNIRKVKDGRFVRAEAGLKLKAHLVNRFEVEPRGKRKALESTLRRKARRGIDLHRRFRTLRTEPPV